MGIEILFLALALTLVPIAILIGAVMIIRRNIGGAGRTDRRGSGGSPTTGTMHYTHSHGEHQTHVHVNADEGMAHHLSGLEHRSDDSAEGKGADATSSSSESPLQSFVDAAGISFSDSSSSSYSYDSSSSSSSYDSGSSFSSSDSSSSSSFSSDW